MDGSDGCTTVRKYLMPLKCTLKNGYDNKFYVYFTTKKKKRRREKER